MKTLFLTLAFFAAIGSSDITAQPLTPGEWRTYTSMRSVSDMSFAPDSSHVWVVTNGGAFRVNLKDASEHLFALRTTNGLAENDLTAVAVSSTGDVFIGGRTGSFDIFRSSTGSVERHGADIDQSSYTVKTVNGIAINGDSVFLATAYGVSLYRDASPGYFLLTVAPLGPLMADSVRQVMVAGGYVYAAMGEGLAYARINSDLQNYRNWTLVPDTLGAVRALAYFRGTVYAGATDGLYRLSADKKMLNAVTLPQRANVNHLLAASDSLYVLDNSGSISSTADLQQFVTQNCNAQTGSVVTAVLHSRDIPLCVGSAFNGIGVSSGGNFTANIFPPGPINNSIVDLHYSPALDRLFATNGIYGFGDFQPNGETWEDFVGGAGTTPAATFVRVMYDSIRGYVWFCSSSPPGKIIRLSGITTGSFIWKLIGTPQYGVPSTRGSLDYVASGQPIIDRAGRCVIPIWGGEGEGLTITSDGEHFNNYQVNSGPNAYQPYGCVTQDMEGNFWVGTVHSDEPKGTGLFWRDTVNRTYGNIPAGSGQTIANEFINAVLTDQDDGIWVGSEGGVQIVSNPSAIESPNPRFSIRSIPLLASQIVHAMAVDGVGNKWIGTDNGIFVVSPDGADSVARFTKENSPLIDNTVLAIAMDVKRGEAYIGTPSGISRFNTIYKQGNPDYSGIHVFPNPVVQNSEENPTIHIDGLVAGSTVKVFTVDGRLVAAINGANLGSTVTWSGRDDLGRQVPSGIYLITATSPQSGANGQAKVVIIRKP